ncbi:phosphatidate cytidylyltransferase [Anaerobacterium chartisolvens]|uniref:Phosphatidate cytidylyltransferase n=1 Tax=Anaerobacterium chartisolvens TaxID=1297424 RepID=A0A369AVA5_9FIRM|nr:phosphatidate cytidylyltransferase [Anaerobacterium chartisolvens]RCX11394.1 phosphatidate cytidylyltransferase [Anaerobacterium chartisolvens]
MNKTRIRIISSIVGIILLLAVVLAGNLVLAVFVTLLALIGIHEFYNAASNKGIKPIRPVGYIWCFIIFFAGLHTGSAALSLPASVHSFALALFVTIIVLFSAVVFSQNKFNINDISVTLFGIVYIVFLLSFIVLTRNLAGGAFFIWMIFIGAWATDTFAYFSGILLGKTKILPVISPKKSLEGSIGGAAGCIAVMLLYGVIINKNGWVGDGIALYHFVIIGAVCGVISQIGDWAASAVKRFVGVKDYGSIMPGHGGVLDRFDSILFVAPVVYFYLKTIIHL